MAFAMAFSVDDALPDDVMSWETSSMGATSGVGSRRGSVGSRCGTSNGRPSSSAGIGAISSSDMPKMLPLRADLLLCNTLFEELDDGISGDVLRHVTGKDDLKEVDFLEMQVDAVSGTQQVETIGQFLPNLEQLRLNQSMICSIRDLGTSYGKLRVLSLRQSHLQDIGGIVAMHVLEELYISFNDVRDLSPLSTHDTLQVLDVEGNLIEDLEDIQSLQMLSTLRELTLNSNPVCKREEFSREWVLQALPQIEVLDDKVRGGIESGELGALEEDLETASLDDFDMEPFREPEELFSSALDEEESSGLRELRCRSAHGSSREEIVPSPEPIDSECGYSPAVEELRKGFAKLRDDSLQDSETHKENRKDEPSEQELIVENLKKSRPPVPNMWSLKAMTARSADKARPMTGFLPDRRGLRTAWSNGSSTTYRPSSSGGISSSTKTSSSIAHSAVPEDLDPNSSDLTMGDDGAVLAGNALAAARRRRKVAKERGEDESNIRDMLRRYQTYSQESCLSDAELELRRKQLETKRPGTSDVRVSAPRLLTANGRSIPISSLPGAPVEVERRWAPPTKRPSSRKGLDLEDGDYIAPTFATEVGESLIVD